MTTGTSNPPVRQVAGPAACQRNETDAATTHHTGSQSADISPRCSAASPGRRGRLDPATRYNAELRPAVRARATWAMFRYDASQALPKIQYPPSCFTGNLDSLNIHETAASAGAPNLFGWNPRGIYPSTNADTQCRYALRCFPTSCNNHSRDGRTLPDPLVRGAGVQPRRCVTLYLDVRFHSASPPPLQLT